MKILVINESYADNKIDILENTSIVDVYSKAKACGGDCTKSATGTAPCNGPCNDIQNFADYQYIFFHISNSEFKTALITWNKETSYRMLDRLILFTGGSGGIYTNNEETTNEIVTAIRKIIKEYNIEIMANGKFDSIDWKLIKGYERHPNELISALFPKTKDALSAIILLCEGYLIAFNQFPANKLEKRYEDIFPELHEKRKMNKIQIEISKNTTWKDVFDGDFSSAHALLKKIDDEIYPKTAGTNIKKLVSWIYTNMEYTENMISNAYNEIFNLIGEQHD